MSSEDLQLYYQILLNARKDLYLAISPRAGFEMAVLRMMLFRPGESEQVAHKKVVGVRPDDKKEPNTTSQASTPVSSETVEKNPKCDDWAAMNTLGELQASDHSTVEFASIKEKSFEAFS